MELGLVFNAVTATAITAGVVFAIIQIRQAERQRRQTAVTNMIASLLAPHVVEAHARLFELPDDAPDERFDPEIRRAFYALAFALEGIGVLVHERAVDLHTVDRQMGGLVRAGWRKVRRFADAERLRSNPSIGEWWEWLYDRMEADPSPGKGEGAHVAFRGWRR